MQLWSSSGVGRLFSFCTVALISVLGFLSFQDHSIIELLLAFETFLISCVTRHVGFKTGYYGRGKIADVVYSASRFQRKQGGATRRRFGPFRQQQRPAEHIRNDLGPGGRGSQRMP